MKKIIIAGSGPVGSFMAVLCAQLGFSVTVYEKREEFTRNINVKLGNNFFKEVHEMLSRLDIKTEFFAKLNEYLHGQKNRILIKELEERFTREAKSLGVQYVIREVKNFEELYNELAKQETKLQQDLDKKKLRQNTSLASRPIIATLPKQTSLLVHAKDFVIKELKKVIKSLKNIDKEQVKEYLVRNTIFPKIGERLNNEQVVSSKFDVENVQKYKGGLTL